MSLLILECTPEEDNYREGLILEEFLGITDPKLTEFVEIRDDQDLLDVLEDERYLEDFEIIHLSGHGVVEDDIGAFLLPDGEEMYPEDFPEFCFAGKTVSLSACQLGRVQAFCDPLADQTDVKNIIAPQREVEFIDAAVWFVNFYYFLLMHRTRVTTAFDKTQDHLEGKVHGAFRLWQYE
ncbi:hypothetical protein FGU65_01605 [Methanoculleus sp. FWC-SCC1]|uniref:CHAT domain-containing protein n=1 Tax=Methanoculleus frigidifontis TaxID=2584085 RepID=A0ABT8M6P7_9EURY|nr:hypothetical protein [Methanoculleus sp. FWC-SCC1]MDN7023605.1 hypothetical protein [Methanoculleus sp. FWC-SCC1]